MLIRNYTLRFVTPAFLGNAEQAGQWRTPPIKALLRQWWRVAYAADQPGGINSATVSAMRVAEGELFGVAADSEGASRKSQVRIRLGHWNKGGSKPWDGTDVARVEHPEVKNRDGQVSPVGPMLYLGYGPLVFAQGQTTFKAGAPIQANENAVLSLALPAGAQAQRVDLALWLLHQYGTLGGRSRNGWGSFSLVPEGHGTPTLTAARNERLTADWQSALQRDWPHAIGRDTQGPLIWQTDGMSVLKNVMRRLAEIKIGLRTQFVFPNASPPHAKPLPRHWLSYPITRHSTSDWDRNARLPNSLRFKVRADADGQLRGVTFHMPCLPPPQFKPDRSAVESVWLRVHRFLDEPAQALQRTAA